MGRAEFAILVKIVLQKLLIRYNIIKSKIQLNIDMLTIHLDHYAFSLFIYFPTCGPSSR